jgi:heptosyltransferase-2
MDHILIIRLSSLGDVILATSVIDASRRLWPGGEITFVTKEEYAPVLDQNPQLTRWIPLSPSERGSGAVYRLGRALRRDGVSLVLDLQGGFRGRLLTATVGAHDRRRVNSRRLSRMLMVARPKRWREALPHTVERYLECLSSWGGESPFSNGPRVWLTDIERSQARSKICVGSRQLVGLAPGAKWIAKRWPERKFAQLAQALAGEGVGVMVAGSEEERPLIERIVKGAGRSDLVKVFSGGLRGLAAAFSVCQAAVCNDSGLMHLAAAVGTPALGIFGPTAPHFGFAPFGSAHKTLWLGFECSPCSLHGDKPCRIAQSAPCMEGLDSNEVLSALRPMLKASIDGGSDRREAFGRNA